NPAMTIRGRTSAERGGTASNATRARRRELAIATSSGLHLHALVRERQLFHRHVVALGVEGAADVLDDPRAEQVPGLDRRAPLLVHQRDPHGPQRVLVALPDLVEPLV